MNSKNANIGKTIPQAPGRNRHLPQVIYEDDCLIAFDKPSGMLVAPDRWNKERGCLVDLVHRHISPEAFNVHRIDAETSGAVLFAKTREALRITAQLFEKRLVEKRYLAIVSGVPPDETMTVKVNMRQDNFKPGRMMVTAKGGMKTETKIRLARKWRYHSLLEVFPVTGKTHQIRVHLAHIECHIVADRVYGGGAGLMLSSLKKNYHFSRAHPEKPLIGRLALHASSISFEHPATGQIIKIEALMPGDFSIAIKYLDKFS